MEITRILFCCVFAALLFADVIVSRSTHGGQGDLTSMVRDIDNRLIAEQQRHQRHQRRRRRNVTTHNIAIMEYCLLHPNQCRREIERLRRAQAQQRRVVIVIEK